MSVNIEQIKSLNARATKLNAERNKVLGAIEQAKKEFDKRVTDYKKAYGVDITPANLESEYNAVVSDITKQEEDLKNKLEYIESGAYKADIKKAEEVKPEISVAEPPVQTAESILNGVGATENIVVPELLVPPTMAKVSEILTPPTMTSEILTPPTNIASAETNAMKTTKFEADEEDISEKPFTPTTWGVQNPTEINNQSSGEITAAKFE